LFLYPPSKLGLTSPVGGAAGRFLVRKGRIQIGPQHWFLRPEFIRGPNVSLKDFTARIRHAQEE
jgi:hypothetical protein